MNTSRWPHILCAGIIAATLAGCSSMSTRTIEYIGVNRYAPSDAAKVGILREPPTRAHDRLGEVVVDISTDPAPPIAKIETEIKAKAARLGADAVVIVHDQAEPAGLVPTGPWWSPSYTPVVGRVVVAVAIKYK